MEQFDWVAKCLKASKEGSAPESLALKTLALYDTHQSLKKRQRHISLVILMATIPVIAGLLYFLTWMLEFDPFYLLRKAFQTNFQMLTANLTIIVLSGILVAFTVVKIIKMRTFIQKK